MTQQTKSIKKYYKHSQTGYIVCEMIFESDTIHNIRNMYLDLHMRSIGREFDLTGFLPLKEKKFSLYRNRWDAGEINSWNYKPIVKSITDIRKEKLEKLNNILKRNNND